MKEQYIKKIIIVSIENYGNADRCLALDNLAGALRKHTPHQVTCLNSARTNIKNIFETIRQISPDIICISVRPGGLDYFKLLARDELIRHFEGLLVFGGLTVSASPEIFLNMFPDSIAVTGEGEEAIVLLSQWRKGDLSDLEQIPNLSFISEGSIRNTIRRVSPTSFISPTFDDANNAINSGSVCWVETSRSCSFKCIYCSNSISHLGTRWRPLPLEQVKNELVRLASQGAEVVSFADMNTYESLDRLIQLEELFSQLPSSLKVRFDVRADSIVSPKDTESEALRRRLALQNLRKTGLVQVFVGYESTSPVQLRRLRKNSRLNNQNLALELLRSLNIDFVLGYMALDPLMTIEELQNNVNSLLSTGLISNISTPLKQTRVQRRTPLEAEMRNKGLLKNLQDNALYFDYDYLDKRMRKFSNVIDYFYFTTAKVYRHSYITSMLRCSGRATDVMPQFESFSLEYKKFELALLQDGLKLCAVNDDQSLVNLVRAFSNGRMARFSMLADFYAALISNGFEQFKADMMAFCSFIENPHQHQLVGVDPALILNGDIKFQF